MTNNRWKTFLAVVLFLVVALASILIWNFTGLNRANAPLPNTSNEARYSIAVLPFINLSGDLGYDFFSDGITEEILNSLANIQSLSVAGRTSSFLYKNSDIGIQEIGKQLKVNLILEGSVRKSGDIIRITAQLINVSDGYHLWSEVYNRELDDIFKIQESIARNIARKLNLTISERGEDQFELYSAKKYEPYELSLKGRAILQHRIEGIEEAKECFEKAIALDPGYAPAYADLAVTYYWMGIYFFTPAREAFPLSVAYAEQALALDPNLIPSHKFIAWSLLYYHWDWQAALEEYEKIKVDENSPEHFFYCIYQSFILGDIESAIILAREILERDPYSIRSKLNLAYLLLIGRQYENAKIILNDITRQNPYTSEGFRYLGLIHLLQENYEKAIDLLEQAIEISEGKGSSPFHLLCAKAALGEIDQNSLLYRKYMKQSPDWVYPAKKAMVFMYMDNPDSAFYWLDIAYEKRDYLLTSIKVAPEWDKFRNDRRFDALLLRMNFGNNN